MTNPVGPLAVYERDIMKNKMKEQWLVEQKILREAKEFKQITGKPEIVNTHPHVRSRLRDNGKDWKIAREQRIEAERIRQERKKEQFSHQPDTMLTKQKNEELIGGSYKNPFESWRDQATRYLQARTPSQAKDKPSRPVNEERLAALSQPRQKIKFDEKGNRLTASALRKMECRSEGAVGRKVDYDRLSAMHETGKKALREREVGIDPRFTGVPKLCKRSLQLAEKRSLRSHHLTSGKKTQRAAQSAPMRPPSSAHRVTSPNAPQVSQPKFAPPARTRQAHTVDASALPNTVASIKVSKDVGDNIFDKFLEREKKRSTFVRDRYNVQAKLKEHEEIEECTFQPRINKKSKEMAERRNRNSIQYHRRPSVLELERRSAEAQRLREERELSECTFRPELHSWMMPEEERDGVPVFVPRKSQSVRQEARSVERPFDLSNAHFRMPTSVPYRSQSYQSDQEPRSLRQFQKEFRSASDYRQEFQAVQQSRSTNSVTPVKPSRQDSRNSAPTCCSSSATRVLPVTMGNQLGVPSIPSLNLDSVKQPAGLPSAYIFDGQRKAPPSLLTRQPDHGQKGLPVDNTEVRHLLEDWRSRNAVQ